MHASKLTWLLAAAAVTAVCVGAAQADTQPEQIHLAYGKTASEMTVMWSTKDKAESVVLVTPIDPAGLASSSQGKSFHFSQLEGISEYIHYAFIGDLTPGSRYTYKVGDGTTWSQNYTMIAKNDSLAWAPVLAVYGDLGHVNSQSLPRLVKEVQDGDIDMVLHVGDFAYDFDTNGGENGDAFMQDITPIAANVPYQTTPGNHEGGTDFAGSLKHYMHRFLMPGKGDAVHHSEGNNVYYSFDVGPAHIISFSSEAYFWQLWDTEEQYAWIKKDLENVDRTKTPWVITMAHRPMYCSNANNDDCTKEDSVMRLGIPVLGARFFAMEKLFQEHKVDLAFWAHEHSYERSFPVYNNQVMNGSVAEPYVNAKAPVHIVAGAAGCREKHDNFNGPRGPWSAFRSETYGYGKLFVQNATHLYWEQYEDTNGTIIDTLSLVKSPAHNLADRFLKKPQHEDVAKYEQNIYSRTRKCLDKHTRLPECADWSN